jgi:hypothetical protein
MTPARSGNGMGFVVKATGPFLGSPAWLTTPWPDGSRSVAIREVAAVFQTAEDASVAIEEMPRILKDAGIIFSVESAD